MSDEQLQEAVSSLSSENHARARKLEGLRAHLAARSETAGLGAAAKGPQRDLAAARAELASLRSLWVKRKVRDPISQPYL